MLYIYMDIIQCIYYIHIHISSLNDHANTRGSLPQKEMEKKNKKQNRQRAYY